MFKEVRPKLPVLGKSVVTERLFSNSGVGNIGSGKGALSAKPAPPKTPVSGDPNFIQKATANSHGQFRAKAKAAGMSTASFANKEKKAKGKTGKQARLALNLMGLNK